MKKCPQCNSVFEDETFYCLNDGTPLVNEMFSMPSANTSEEPTLVRSEPIVINLASKNEPLQPTVNFQTPPPAENVFVVPARNAPANKNYALFLVIGLLIGGALVLATLLLSRNFSQSANTTATNKSVNVTVKTPQPNNENNFVETVSSRHNEPNEAANNEDFNGRVIALNARIRSAPDMDASVIDTLPMDDRLNIIRRENSNSPWYEAECEHGTSGWMHGNTIEFTR